MSALVLPPLREDLALSRGPVMAGVPTWTVYDPARHRYIRLGWQDFEILSRWGLRDPAAIVAALEAETTLRPGAADILQLAAFCRDAELLRPVGAADSARLAASARRGEHGVGTWLIHNYLFLRLRLLNPDRLLAGLLPFVGFLFTRAFLGVLVGGVALALFLVSREWDSYTHSLVALFSLDGLLWMGVALSGTKVIHELGHGLAAKRLGCRVPAMGVAFLVLWPVLWTDTTDAWRLVRRRDRLLIDGAGMLAEITVAVLATLMWAILPDGPARDAAFVLSSSTWILTLLVNLSPLMRFDGYYILSDLLDVANLQDRAFRLARWRLREALFRPGVAAPERHATGLGAVLLAYAYASWVYRFFLFTGIAVLVYHLAFKALGVVLMGIELWFFVCRPILGEVVAMARLGMGTRLNRHGVVTLVLLGGLVGLAVVPWRGRVDAPGILRAARQATLYTAEPGRLLALAADQSATEAGAALFTLASADIAHAIRVASAQLAAAQADLASRSFDAERRRAQQAAAARASEAAAAFAHAEARAADLTVRAPFAGIVVDVPRSLAVGADIKRLEPLGVLIDPAGPVVEAYVSENDLDRVALGAGAVFLRGDGSRLGLRVTDIALVSTRALEAAELGSPNGGAIPARRDARGVLVPEHAVYRVQFAVQAGQAVTSREVGHVVIGAPAESLVRATYRRAVALLQRETAL